MMIMVIMIISILNVAVHRLASEQVNETLSGITRDTC